MILVANLIACKINFFMSPMACKPSSEIKIEPLYSLQWLSQFLSGLATCVGYAWLSGDQPRRLLFT